jgi:hypothetical protein
VRLSSEDFYGYRLYLCCHLEIELIMLLRSDYGRRRGRGDSHNILFLLSKCINLDHPIIDLVLLVESKNHLIHFIANPKQKLLLGVQGITESL